MLCQFSFQNYKSFKDEAFLDLFAEPISEHKDSLINNDNGDKILPVISIYGPNGGGKSTVLEALNYLRNLVTLPFNASQINEENSFAKFANMSGFIKGASEDKFHKFDKSCEYTPIRFEIMFRTKGKQYKYELAILKNEILEENLYYQMLGQKDTFLVYERSGETCKKGKEIEFASVDKVKKSLPLLSYFASSYDIECINDVIKWFVNINVLNYDDPKRDVSLFIPKNEDERALFFELLSEMDINIVDIRIEEDAEGKVKELFTIHKIGDEKFELRIQDESSGTRKLFSCLTTIYDCLSEGELLIADELDAKLHPKLMRYIIELFTNSKKNKNGAQLLMTSHDTVNMNSEVFRRDEIWFCAINSENASHLYSLVSFKEKNGKTPRKDSIYGKRYLEGKYGADPYIGKGLCWERDNK